MLFTSVLHAEEIYLAYALAHKDNSDVMCMNMVATQTNCDMIHQLSSLQEMRKIQ